MNRLCSEKKRRETEKTSSNTSLKRFKGNRWSTDDETNEEFSSTSNSDDDEFSSRSVSIVNEFEEISRENSRKTFDLTRCSTNETKEKWKFQLRNTFHRDDLLSEGYGLISEKEFPFFSTCFMVSEVTKILIETSTNTFVVRLARQRFDLLQQLLSSVSSQLFKRDRTSSFSSNGRVLVVSKLRFLFDLWFDNEEQSFDLLFSM